ncbi:MAG: hypothetical protein JWQ43_3640 [Glaciihabitans sp.]|nr:hypothetical protein [Glaciihabitans sp.]
MTRTQMDTGFASGVRAELTAIGTRRSGLQRLQRRTRALALGVGALALAGATTGAAVVVANLPGATTVAPLGSSVSATFTGTGQIDLGPAPDNATSVLVDLSCDVGQLALLTVPDADSAGPAWAGVDCAGSDGDVVHVDDGLLPPAGSTSITVTADDGTTWTATAQYATSSTTDWGTNADGQSYGVANVHGVPDLTRARADNGEWGYVYSAEAMATEGEGFLTVFGADGHTVVGQQAFHTLENIPVDESLIPHVVPEGGGE